MSSQFEVLSPWAEADPVPLKGLSPRVADLSGKKIGLLYNTKRAGRPIVDVVGKRLKEKFPGVEFNYFERRFGTDIDRTTAEYQMGGRSADSKEILAKFEEWVEGVDAVIGAVGD